MACAAQPGGTGYHVSARVLRASDGETLIAVREAARGEDELLAAMDRLSRRLRERIGESLRTVRASEPLAQVTTPSLEALQLYSRGVRLITAGTSNDMERAAQLIEQAVAIDSGFAIFSLIAAGRLADAEAELAVLRRRFPDDPAGDRMESALLTARGELARARRASESYHARLRSPLARALALAEQAVIAQFAGQPRRSDALMQDVLALLHEADADAMAREILLLAAVLRIEEEGPAAAAPRVSATEARWRATGADTAAAAERAWPDLARFYVATGQVARARATRDAFERDVVRPGGTRALALRLQELDGELLVREGHVEEGIRLLRQAMARTLCPRCLLPVMAWAFDEAAMPDSALAYYERFLASTTRLQPVDFVWRTRALLRAAELNEAAGNTERARAHYGTLLHLWSDAEPAMRPRVDAVRERLARLMPGG